MTKQILLVASFAAAIINTACKKDQPFQNAAPKLVKMYPTNAPADPMILNYDAQGRLIEQSTSLLDYKFSYQKNQFSGSESDVNNGQYFSYSNGQLDFAGRLIQMDGTYTPNNGPVEQLKYSFDYDPSGHIMKLKWTNLTTGNVSEYDYTYAKENIVSVATFINSQLNYTLQFDYFDNLTNKVSLDVERTVFGFLTDKLTGKRSTNLVKEMKVVDNLNIVTTDYTYDYQLDANAYPVVRNTTNKLANTQWSTSYEYSK